MPFVTDTFTDTAGTALESHTGEAGATWTRVATGQPANSVTVTAAGRIRGNDNAGNANVYSASGTPASADYSVQADFVFATTGGGTAGLVGRYAGGDGYELEFNNNFGWRLFILSNNSHGSQIGSTFGTIPNAGDTVTATLSFSGTSISVSLSGAINQSNAITATDSTVAAAGKAAVRFTFSALSDAAGVHFDNLSATDAGGGGAVGMAAERPRRQRRNRALLRM